MGEVRRKKIRLPASAYEHGWYFVTICTQARMKVLAQIRPVSVGADDSVRPCGVLLTPLGSIVRECLERLSDDAAGISVDKYVTMPNHIHVIICIDGEKGGQSRPPLQRLMQRFKSITTRRAWNMGYTKLWQRSYYDHAIRNDADYLRTWQYIHDNPARWAEDEYYSE